MTDAVFGPVADVLLAKVAQTHVIAAVTPFEADKGSQARHALLPASVSRASQASCLTVIIRAMNGSAWMASLES